jgi:hypothetical protein
MTRAAIVLLLMFACAFASAAPMRFDRFVANFVLKAFGTTVGRSEWRLLPLENNRFLWESRSRSAGAGALFHDVYVTERSESELFGPSFRPIAYHYDRYAGTTGRKVQVIFDWRDGVALNTAKGHTWRMPRSMQYAIADGGRVKRYDMRVLGTETLETALGTLETLKIRRLRHAAYGEATLWCAPALGYLPVKLEHRDRDGRLVSMYIVSIEGMPPTVMAKPGG